MRELGASAQRRRLAPPVVRGAQGLQSPVEQVFSGFHLTQVHQREGHEPRGPGPLAQLSGEHRAALMQEQVGQERADLQPTDRDGRAVRVPHHQRAKHPKPHDRHPMPER
ncbi:hypothetical protein ITP53_28665 [Nonomuraea sp. K274]|uniref:Uncharacterized protein n=1 Tax=Nonomuraea cypriaca TaxID=1187855 RepID=A0A931F1I2_9ACTN|nr:hypothetical protein [Nonomuraea cypriaca]MBF8189637.1 hypothetical protein [Nonomuraea cypriaca]